jgi:hypothetical protein
VNKQEGSKIRTKKKKLKKKDLAANKNVLTKKDRVYVKQQRR